MKQMGKWASSLCALLVLLPLAGCWSRVEINKRAYVTGIYVDSADNGKVMLTMGFPLPNRMTSGQVGGQPKGNPYTSVSRVAENLPEAYRALQSELPRYIHFGNLQFIVVGQKYAKQAMEPLLEFLGRHPDILLKTYLFVSSGQAKDLAEISATFERFPQEVIKSYADNRNTLDATVKDFIEAYEYGGDMALPILNVETRKIKSEEKSAVTWVSTDDVALFKDGKMVDHQARADNRGVLAIKNRVNFRNSQVEVQSPTDGKTIGLYMGEFHSSIHPSMKNGSYVFTIRIRSELTAIYSVSDLHFTDPPQVAQLARRVEQDMADRVEGVFQAAKKAGTDAFRMGQLLQIYYPREWDRVKEDWRRVYQDKAEFATDVRVHIRRIGSEKNADWYRDKIK